MPLGAVLGVIAMLLVAIFFVSGADAASIVMGTLSQRGTIHPGRGVVIFWGSVMGAIAAIMLLVGGGPGRRPVRHPEHHDHHGGTVRGGHGAACAWR